MKKEFLISLSFILSTVLIFYLIFFLVQEKTTFSAKAIYEKEVQQEPTKVNLEKPVMKIISDEKIETLVVQSNYTDNPNRWSIPGLDTAKSTNFSQASDKSSVALTLASSKVAVKWQAKVDARNDSYHNNILLGADFISVNSANLDPTINTSATVSISGLNCNNFKLYYAPGFYTTSAALKSAGQIIATEANLGGHCYDISICTNVQCSNQVLSFTAQHFSGFAAANGTYLTIWDDTDTQTKYINDQVNFFANYSNASGPITSANCNITFQVAPQGPFAMVYNAGNTLYESNRSFSSVGNFNWDVNCSAISYTNLKAADTVSISTTLSIPEFSTYAMLLALVIVIAGFFLTQRRKV